MSVTHKFLCVILKSLCGCNRKDIVHDERAIYLACYWLSYESEFNFLAAFEDEEDAKEYISRSVWSHLKMFVSKQPLY